MEWAGPWPKTGEDTHSGRGGFAMHSDIASTPRKSSAAAVSARVAAQGSRHSTLRISARVDMYEIFVSER
jgi:hypothetical protein